MAHSTLEIMTISFKRSRVSLGMVNNYDTRLPTVGNTTSHIDSAAYIEEPQNKNY